MPPAPLHRNNINRLLGKGLGEATADGNDIDCGVNANVLWYAALEGRELPVVCQYLVGAVRDRDIPRCSLYYLGTPHVAYLVARAYSAGARCLSSAIEPLRQIILATQLADGSFGDDLDTAAAVAALVRLNDEGDSVGRGVRALVQRQRPDGSWRAGGFIWPFHGSEVLTTAIALDGLVRYREAQIRLTDRR